MEKKLSQDDVVAIEALLAKLDPEVKKKHLSKFLNLKPLWMPNAGPQEQAYHSEADELFYGGQAGGGKTDLGIGLSLTKHKYSLVLRRTNKEAQKLFERFFEIVGSRDGWNGQENVWRINDRVIDIGGCQHEEDRQKYKGNPHDLIFFDEVSDFTESQFRFISAWNRAADKSQRCRVVCAGNPPTTPEGLWVLKYWGPWIDPMHHAYPVPYGEIRYFTTIDGEDTMVEGRGPHVVDGREIIARSRTFIPAKLTDNPDLAETNYLSVLANLPPELRAAYMEGKWDVGTGDHDFQVIPSAWAYQAQARWKPDGNENTLMTAMAMDPAGGGADAEEIAYRHGAWVGDLITEKGAQTADGSRAAGKIVTLRRHSCPVIVDVGGGYGGQVMMRLKDNGITAHGFNGANRATTFSRDGQLMFTNKRAEAWWRLREELNPDQEGGAVIALPPGPELLADLCTPRWKLTPNGIQIETKDEIRKRLGRSPGKGDAVAMCLSEGQTIITRELWKNQRGGGIKNIRQEPKKRR